MVPLQSGFHAHLLGGLRVLLIIHKYSPLVLSQQTQTQMHANTGLVYICARILFLDTDHVNWDHLTETIRQS